MADVRKIVNGEVTEQAWSDTNTQVVELFENKPDLQSVTLGFDGSQNLTEKRYERL